MRRRPGRLRGRRRTAVRTQRLQADRAGGRRPKSGTARAERLRTAACAGGRARGGRRPRSCGSGPTRNDSNDLSICDWRGGGLRVQLGGSTPRRARSCASTTARRAAPVPQSGSRVQAAPNTRHSRGRRRPTAERARGGRAHQGAAGRVARASASSRFAWWMRSLGDRGTPPDRGVRRAASELPAQRACNGRADHDLVDAHVARGRVTA